MGSESIAHEAEGIRNTAQEIRNPTNDLFPDSKFHWWRLESNTLNTESTALNPEPGKQTVLDSLLMGRSVELWTWFQFQFITSGRETPRP